MAKRNDSTITEVEFVDINGNAIPDKIHISDEGMNLLAEIMAKTILGKEIKCTGK